MLKKNPPIRSTKYLKWIRTLPCAAAGNSRCEGHVEASHHGPRGMSQKTDDYRVLPLCWQHHHAEWGAKGTLFGWPREIADAWIQEQIIIHLMRYIGEF